MSKFQTRKCATGILGLDSEVFADALGYAVHSWLYENDVICSERASIKVSPDGKEASVVTRRKEVDVERTACAIFDDWISQREFGPPITDASDKSTAFLAIVVAINATLEEKGYTMEKAIYCTTEARSNELMDLHTGECHIYGCDHAI